MALKVFFDANIILDFVLQREGYVQSMELIAAAEQKKIFAFTSPSVIQICSYWTAKAYGVAKAKEIMAVILSFIQTIDTPHEQVLAAIHSSMTDIEDALLYYTAIHHRMDMVISRDTSFQQAALPSLPVVPPADLLQTLAAEEKFK